jgi:DNA polymerase elongation subunit (family B)
MSFYTNTKVVGNQIYLRGVNSKGKRYKEKVKYSPTVFLPTKDDSRHKTLDGKNVKPFQPGGIKDARNFIKNYKDVSNYDIYGNDNFAFCFIGDRYPKDIDYNIKKIVIANIDIEVASDAGFPNVDTAGSAVISIAIRFNDVLYVFGYDEPAGCSIERTLAARDIKYFSCDDEKDLLIKFLICWREHSPDIITGWNVSGFDIPYLYNRIIRIFPKGEEVVRALSPWNYVSSRNVYGMYGKEQLAVDISGVSILDYLDLYKKFTYANRESYRLDYIANVELGESKLSYSEFGSLHTLYKRDYDKFIEYNVKDVELVGQLEDKMKLIEMAVALAYSAKVNYSDVFSQVRMWDSICYHYLRKQNIVLPPKKKSSKTEQIVGAYVKEPQVGMHKWVVSFDLNSLYPHLMMQYNISPEKLIPVSEVNKDLADLLKFGSPAYDKIINKEFDTSLLDRDNLTVTPNLMFFRKDSQGFFPAILEDLYERRKSSKKKMIESQRMAEESTGVTKRKYLNLVAKHNNDQLARKVQLNSAYGALGNQYFRFFDSRIAEAVTTSGQLSIRWIEKRFNDYLNDELRTNGVDYIIASDTDSIYVRMDEWVDVKFAGGSDENIVDYLDKMSSTIFEEYVDKCFLELAEYLNVYDQKMFMSREAIASRGLWTAKKRYVLNVHDNEGVRYNKPKLKIMGLEAVKSSTPEICREKIKESLNVIMNGTEDELIEHIDLFRTEFNSLPAEDIAFPRGVNGIKKYTNNNTYIKHTPIHVKGSIIYNRLIKENNLSYDYEKISDGNKVRFLYLKEPNPLKDYVISFVNNLPKEFELDDYIDYDKQFVKSFLDPIKVMLDCVGWKTEKTSSLERFFI